jgi:hypothetical protein
MKLCFVLLGVFAFLSCKKQDTSNINRTGNYVGTMLTFSQQLPLPPTDTVYTYNLTLTVTTQQNGNADIYVGGTPLQMQNDGSYTAGGGSWSYKARFIGDSLFYDAQGGMMSYYSYRYFRGKRN